LQKTGQKFPLNREVRMMDINKEIAEHTTQVEAIITKYLPKESGYQKTVMEAMNYSFLAGGKRLRPMLMQETYRLFGGSSDIIEPFMAAIEMIHTYSLIHDDLPAMDNDDYRRGRKTTHVVYGEAMGILAGDALLNFAFETACKGLMQDVGNPAVARAVQILAQKAGIYGMLGGQVVDVESEGQPLEREKLDFIYDLKTGALIEASMLIGAVLAGASEKEQQVILQVAKDVGLAFQIQDDILDVTSDMETLGKPIGSDEKNHKTTYVTIRGLAQAQKDVEKISERALEGVASLSEENVFLNELIRYLIHRKK
jgi:geranylgeranyl diphosphate synthase type II